MSISVENLKLMEEQKNYFYHEAIITADPNKKLEYEQRAKDLDNKLTESRSSSLFFFLTKHKEIMLGIGLVIIVILFIGLLWYSLRKTSVVNNYYTYNNFI